MDRLLFYKYTRLIQSAVCLQTEIREKYCGDQFEFRESWPRLIRRFCELWFKVVFWNPITSISLFLPHTFPLFPVWFSPPTVGPDAPHSRISQALTLHFTVLPNTRPAGGTFRGGRPGSDAGRPPLKVTLTPGGRCFFLIAAAALRSPSVRLGHSEKQTDAQMSLTQVCFSFFAVLIYLLWYAGLSAKSCNQSAAREVCIREIQEHEWHIYGGIKNSTVLSVEKVTIHRIVVFYCESLGFEMLVKQNRQCLKMSLFSNIVFTNRDELFMKGIHCCPNITQFTPPPKNQRDVMR